MTSSMPSVVAIIPARGGSKGLPGKNLRPLAGVPLIAHSILLARMCPAITRIVVSTDAPEIAEVAKRYGAEVPFMRPSDLARDDTPMIPVIQHAVTELGAACDMVMLLDPTSPGRIPDDVATAVNRMSDATIDGVIACSRPTFNPFWVGVVEREGRLARAFESDRQYTRRQDVPPFYRINGALYLWRRDALVPTASSWWNGKYSMLEIPEARAFSIDDEREFHLLELLVRERYIVLPWLESGA